MFNLLVQPFLEFEFMQTAMLGIFVISLGATLIGVFLLLRGMSLTGDAISHTILPGVAIAYYFYGVSLVAMSIGGFLVGMVVMIGAGYVARKTQLKEDATLTAFYLISLAIGVLIISINGSTMDLMHILFGQVLALDSSAIYLLATITSITVSLLAIFYRSLVYECFDKEFFASVSKSSDFIYYLFLTLAVLNFVAGFQALGTLMVVAIMILPAASAKFWTINLTSMFVIAFFIAVISGYVGLLVSYHLALSTGPSIVLVLGAIYFVSFLFGKYKSFFRNHS